MLLIVIARHSHGRPFDSHCQPLPAKALLHSPHRLSCDSDSPIVCPLSSVRHRTLRLFERATSPSISAVLNAPWLIYASFQRHGLRHAAPFRVHCVLPSTLHVSPREQIDYVLHILHDTARLHRLVQHGGGLGAWSISRPQHVDCCYQWHAGAKKPRTRQNLNDHQNTSNSTNFHATTTQYYSKWLTGIIVKDMRRPNVPKSAVQ
jgi:hypothetical protein